MTDIIDLNILRPEPKYIKIGDRQIDVSFVPCGATFELDKITKELIKIDQKKISKDVDRQREAFDLGIRLCAAFCRHLYPEMDDDWFYNNTNVQQVNAFQRAIQDALMSMYEGVGVHSKK